jgi:hypothetical protein
MSTVTNAADIALVEPNSEGERFLLDCVQSEQIADFTRRPPEERQIGAAFIEDLISRRPIAWACCAGHCAFAVPASSARCARYRATAAT